MRQSHNISDWVKQQNVPSIACKIAIMCYMNRLYHLPERSIVKKVYNVLENLHLQGFTTWITKVRELIHNYNLNVHPVKK